MEHTCIIGVDAETAKELLWRPEIILARNAPNPFLGPALVYIELPQHVRTALDVAEPEETMYDVRRA